MLDRIGEPASLLRHVVMGGRGGGHNEGAADARARAGQINDRTLRGIRIGVVGELVGNVS